MMGETVNTAGGTAGEAAPLAQQKADTASKGPAGAEEKAPAGEGTPEVDQWYKDSGGSQLHPSSLVNADGLKLATYHWDPQDQPLRGKIVLIHGYGVHARFEYLRHDLKHPEAPPHYAKSWIQRLAEAGFSVHALDHQSFGASEGLKGKRAHVQDFDALARDIIQFLHEQVLPAHSVTAPIFLCGISMGGCAVARAVELLAGGHTRCKGFASHSSSHRAEEEEEDQKAAAGDGGKTEQHHAKEKKEQEPNQEPEVTTQHDEQKRKHEKALLPLKGLICLAPMFSLDRMKKKNRLLLPFAKMLATLCPTVEIAKAAKNPMYPAFDTLMKNDPLCYTAKSRARLSYELLYATSAVQEQAQYLAFPDAAALTPQSPLPYPVYIHQAPALLIVESKNDTFVDPEGSVYVAAIAHAKVEASTETLQKYMPYYEAVRATSKEEGHPDATLWMLDNLWHCFTKELPESDALLDRIINMWLLPHAAAANSFTLVSLPQQKNDKAGACAAPAASWEIVAQPDRAAPIKATGLCPGEETAAAASRSPTEGKHEKDKKERTPQAGGDTTGERIVKSTEAAGGQETDAKMIPVGSPDKIEDAAQKQKAEPQGDVQEPEAAVVAVAPQILETAAAEERKDEQQETSACPVAAGPEETCAAASEQNRPASGTEDEKARRSVQQQEAGEHEQHAATERAHAEEKPTQLQETSETSGQPDAGTAEQTSMEENKEQQQRPPQEEKVGGSGTQEEQAAKVERETRDATEDTYRESALPQGTEDRGNTQDL